MNTKGKRFLAVLAVLAFAFVAVSFMSTESSATIETATDDGSWPYVQYSTVTDVVTLEKNTVVEAGKAYYVEAGTYTVTVPALAAEDCPVILFMETDAKVDLKTTSEKSVFVGAFSVFEKVEKSGKLKIYLNNESAGFKALSDAIKAASDKLDNFTITDADLMLSFTKYDTFRIVADASGVKVVTEYVAIVNDEYYSDWNDAVTAAGEEGVIYLLKDLVIAENWNSGAIINLNHAGIKLTIQQGCTFSGKVAYGESMVTVNNFVAGLGGVIFTAGSVEISGVMTAEQVAAAIEAATEDVILKDLIISGGTLNINDDVAIEGDVIVMDNATVTIAAEKTMDVKEGSTLNVIGNSAVVVDGDMVVNGALSTDNSTIGGAGTVTKGATGSTEEATVSTANITINGGVLSGSFENDVTIIADTIIKDELYINGDLTVDDVVVKVAPGAKVTVKGNFDAGEGQFLNAGTVYVATLSEIVAGKFDGTSYSEVYVARNPIAHNYYAKSLSVAYLTINGLGAVTIGNDDVLDAGFPAFAENVDAVDEVQDLLVFFESGVLFTVDVEPDTDNNYEFLGEDFIEVYSIETLEPAELQTNTNNRWIYTDEGEIYHVEVTFIQLYNVTIYDKTTNAKVDNTDVLLSSEFGLIDTMYDAGTISWKAAPGFEAHLFGVHSDTHYYKFEPKTDNIVIYDDYDFEMPAQNVEVYLTKSPIIVLTIESNVEGGELKYGTVQGVFDKSPIYDMEDGKYEIITAVGEQLYFQLVAPEGYWAHYIDVDGVDEDADTYEEEPYVVDESGVIELTFTKYATKNYSVVFKDQNGDDFEDGDMYWTDGELIVYPDDGKFVLTEGNTYTFVPVPVLGYELDIDVEYPANLVVVEGNTVYVNVGDAGNITVTYTAITEANTHQITLGGELPGDEEVVMYVVNKAFLDDIQIISGDGVGTIYNSEGYEYYIEVTKTGYVVSNIMYKVDPLDGTYESKSKTLLLPNTDVEVIGGDVSIEDITVDLDEYKIGLQDQKGGAVILGYAGKLTQDVVVRINNINPNKGYVFNPDAQFVKFYKTDNNLSEKLEEVTDQIAIIDDRDGTLGIGGYFFFMPAYSLIVTIEFEQVEFFFDLPSTITTTTESYNKADWDVDTVFTFTVTPASGKEVRQFQFNPADKVADYELNGNTLKLSLTEPTDLKIRFTTKDITTQVFTERQEYIYDLSTMAEEEMDISDFRLFDQNGEEIPAASYTIRSSNPNVVKVSDRNTKAEIVGPGTANITITYNGMDAKTVVKVYSGILEIDKKVDGNQPIDKGWRIQEGKDITIVKGASLILTEGSTLDLNGRTLTVEGSLVIGTGANVFNGTIVLTPGSNFVNNGSIGKDESVILTMTENEEVSPVFNLPGAVEIRDINGLNVKPVIVESLHGHDLDDEITFYILEMSGDAVGYTPFSYIEEWGGALIDHLSVTNAYMDAVVLFVEDGQSFTLSADSIFGHLLLNEDDEPAEIYVGDSATLNLEGTVFARFVADSGSVPRMNEDGLNYIDTNIALVGIAGAYIETSEELVSDADGVYYYQRIIDLSGTLKGADGKLFIWVDEDTQYLDDTVGVTVSASLILDNFAYCKDGVYNVQVHNATLFVDGFIMLKKDREAPELINVTGATFVQDKIAYIVPLETALGAIGVADHKTIYVYEDFKLSIDLPADSMIVMKNGTKVTIPETANIMAYDKALIDSDHMVRVLGTLTVQNADENPALVDNLTGYHVVTEFENGDVEFCSLQAAIASGKKDIIIADDIDATLTKKTTVPAGVKITIPATSTLTVSKDFTLSEGAVIDNDGVIIFQGTEAAKINVVIDGDIDVSKNNNGFVATNTNLTITGDVNFVKPESVNIDNTNTKNFAYYAPRVGKAYEHHFTNLDDAVAGANEYSTQKYHGQVEVYGKVNGGDLSLADYTELSFIGATSSVDSINLSDYSVLNVDAASKLTGTVTGVSGSALLLNNSVDFKDAGNFTMFVDAIKTDVTTYYTVIDQYDKELLGGGFVGSVTFDNGIVHINDMITGSKFTVNEDAYVIVDGALVIAAKTTAKVNGGLEVADDAQLTTNGMTVSGLVKADKGSEVFVLGSVLKPGMTVTGYVEVDEGAEFAMDGFMVIGTKKTEIDGVATVTGKIDIAEDKYVKAYAGSDVSSAIFNYSDAEKKSVAKASMFFVNGMFYMTVYAFGEVTFFEVVAAEDWEFKGYNELPLIIAESWYNLSGTPVGDATLIGAANFGVVFADIDYKEVNGIISSETGIQVIIDGRNLNTYIDLYTEGLDLTVMETHTIQILAENGYSIDKATITLDGAPVTDGRFALDADAETFLLVIQGAEIVNPSGGDVTVDVDTSGIEEKLKELEEQQKADAAKALEEAQKAAEQAKKDAEKQQKELEELKQTIKDKEIDVTAEVDIEPGNDWNITTILLVILVILIAIMAIIVALRFNRS